MCGRTFSGFSAPEYPVMPLRSIGRPIFFEDVKSSLSFLKCFICVILLSSLAGGQKNSIFSFIFEVLGSGDFSRVQGSDLCVFVQ